MASNRGCESENTRSASDTDSVPSPKFFATLNGSVSGPRWALAVQVDAPYLVSQGHQSTQPMAAGSTAKYYSVLAIRIPGLNESPRDSSLNATTE